MMSLESQLLFICFPKPILIGKGQIVSKLKGGMQIRGLDKVNGRNEIVEVKSKTKVEEVCKVVLN